MKKPNSLWSSIRYYSLLLLMFALVALYLILTARSFQGFLCHQQFLQESSVHENEPVQLDTSTLERMERYTGQHPGYAHTLGTYWFYKTLQARSANLQEPSTTWRSGFEKAGKWFRQSILQNPADPWNYYQLGRVNFDQANGASEKEAAGYFRRVTQLFLAALENAPKDIFLRSHASAWLYHSDPDAGRRFIKEIIANDRDIFIQDPRKDLKFAKLLYDIQMDYESDVEMRRVLGFQEDFLCQAAHSSRNLGKGELYEVRDDNGKPAWKVRLSSNSMRVKKVLCLPENVHDYHRAVLKIFMNRGGSTGLQISISLNDRPLPISEQLLPQVPEWHEIPIEIDWLLHQQPQLSVYIRATALTSESYLEVWSDRETLPSDSHFDAQQIARNSTDTTWQTEGFLIRIILKK